MRKWFAKDHLIVCVKINSLLTPTWKYGVIELKSICNNINFTISKLHSSLVTYKIALYWGHYWLFMQNCF